MNAAADVDGGGREELAFSGLHTVVHVAGSMTDHAVTVLEIRAQPSAGAPRHISHQEDKSFRVLTGQFLFLVGDETLQVTAGDVVHVPPGVVHGFTNTADAQSALLLVAAPGRHDAFFRAMAGLSVPHVWQEVERVAREHGQTLVGDHMPSA